MTSWPLLSLLIWLPIVGGLATLAFGNERANAARWFGVATALATLLLTIPLFTGFDYANPGMQFGEEHAWIPAYDIRYSLGADGISVALIAPDHADLAAGADLRVGFGRQARQPVLRLVPGPRRPDGRRVLLRSIPCCSTCSSRPC